MGDKNIASLRAASPYSGVITREQFLFFEVRTTAGLRLEGLGDQEIVDRIVSENLYQYPTERSVRKMARTCLSRLDALGSDALVEALVKQSAGTAKQICLYAMMKQYRLVWDFMVTVIGEKYRLRDTSYGKIDMNVFFLRLQEQDDGVATWSDSTITKCKQVLNRILVENEYLDSTAATHLNPVLPSRILEEEIRKNHDEAAFPAFNYFS
jgi:hypothetical protein